MKYKVLRKFRWRQKDLTRGDIVMPRTAEEERRCGILVRSGFLAAQVSDELLKNLGSVGIRVDRRAQPVSKALDE